MYRKLNAIALTVAALGVYALVIMGFVFWLLGNEAGARERVDNAVIFLADMSASMDQKERDIVRDSHARAISSHEVVSAIRSGAYGRSAFAYVEYGTSAGVTVNWTLVHDVASARAFGEQIEATSKYRGPATAVGSALVVASNLIRDLPYEALFTTVDVVGDGVSNTGIGVAVPREAILSAGATINAMPMTMRTDATNLADWFSANVVGGPRSFLIELERIEDMPMLMRRKLILELF